MSDHEHGPRENDHLVEPMYHALKREHHGGGGEDAEEQGGEDAPKGPRAGGAGCLVLLALALAGIARGAVEL